MDNTMMMALGGMIEANTRAKLERDFGMRLPPSASDRALNDVGFFDGKRWQKVERPGLFGRVLAALKTTFEIGMAREARV